MSLPYIWKSGREPGAYIDLATFLLENRTIFIGSNITSEVASVVFMQMMALVQQKGSISLYINSQSGSASAGLAIIDMINAISSPDTLINTYCIGECKGIAAAILVSGWNGERRAFPSARISLYQEWYTPKGLRAVQAEDASEQERLMEAVRDIFVKAWFKVSKNQCDN